MPIDREIVALRRVLGASNDFELAEKLGIRNTAVSQWRSRKSLPNKYKLLIDRPSGSEISDALLNAYRFVFFGKPEKSAWMKVAMAAIPPEYYAHRPDETAMDRARRLEQAALRLMTLALSTAMLELDRDTLESDDDCQALIDALKSGHAQDIDRILSDGG